MEMQNRTIGSVCASVYSGGTPKSTVLDYYEGGTIPWLNTKEIDFNRIYKTERFITQKGYDRSSAKWVPENAVIVAMYGATAAKVAITRIPLTTNQACCNLIIDENKADYRYVYYYLLKNYKRLASLANGGAQQNLNAGQIKDFAFIAPCLQEQRRIADILSAIDEKIETNDQVNRELIEYIMTVFTSRFIFFDGCTNLEESEFGVKPQSWNDGCFGDVIETTIGGDWGKEKAEGKHITEVYCIRGADIPEVKIGKKGKMPVRYILEKNYKTKRLKKEDLVVEISGGSPTQSTGRITAVPQSLLERYDKDMICTNFCRAITPKQFYSFFVYAYWQYLYDKGRMFIYENGTTGIKNFDLNAFITTEHIIIPPLREIIEFNRIVEPLYEKIYQGGLENEHLLVMRDRILPGLIEGTVDYSNVQL